jgi:tetratricopeptide (TPR) repeat protein/O-antigen ligase
LVIWDGLVLAGIGLLILFTSLAFGAVDAWAAGIAEVICFSLTILWLAKTYLTTDGHVRLPTIAQHDFRCLALPLALLLTFDTFQLVPLSPGVLHLLSPHAYQLYCTSLPGWPDRTVYDDPAWKRAIASDNSSAVVVLPTVDEVRGGAMVPFAPKLTPGASLIANSQPSATGDGRTGSRGGASSRWRALSVAPILTRAGLLKYCACASLLLLVVFYPVGVGGLAQERTFRRVLVLMALAAGTTIAVIGLTERAFWNGKILWFYIPRDWGAPMPGIHRASGPFVNPDHFANYLAMILPLALVGVIFRTPLDPAPHFSGFQSLCAAASMIIAAAILATISRAGWVELGLAILIPAWLLGWQRRRRLDDELAKRLPVNSVTSWLITPSVGVFIIAGVALLLVGPSEREQTGARITESISWGAGMWDRWSMWIDSGRIVRDYPLFGTGLGSWSTIFPHYQRPPWSPYFAGQAQNDYVEVAVEWGVVGLSLLVWLCWRVGRFLVEGSRSLHPRHWPLFAALVTAIAILGFHELLDFSLQIPANAVLFVVLLGIALRLTRTHRWEPLDRSGVLERHFPPAVLVTTAVLGIIAALHQRETVYPDDLLQPGSIREAGASIASHPSSSFLHVWLADMLSHSRGTWALKELKIAIWLNPNDPVARDKYIKALLAQGNEKAALNQISTAVYLSPRLDSHSYLTPRLLAWLSDKERGAIESGLDKAVAQNYGGSIDSLAQLYSVEGRELDGARLFESAGKREPDKSRGDRYYLSAGRAYATAGKRDRAARLFAAAMELAPDDPEPYIDLITLVYGPEGNSESATTAIQTAISRGINAAPLYLSLGQAAEAARDHKLAETAYRQAADYEPSWSNLTRLGEFYLDHGQFERAIGPIRRAAEIKPQAAEVYFMLAQAEEGAYQYAAANSDYRRAVVLAPDRPEFKSRSLDLLRKIEHSQAVR